MKNNNKSKELNDAWKQYYQTVENARQAIEATPRFTENHNHRAQAYNTLMEAQAMAYNQVIAPRSNNPRVYTHTFWNSTLLSIGQNCGDCLYSLIPLHGHQSYRVTLRSGDIKVMLIQTYSHMHGHPDSQLLGNYDISDFTPNSQGLIDIVFSAKKQEGNWIPLAAESSYNYVMVRRFFADWFDDMGEVSVRMLDKMNGYDESNEHTMAERILLAAGFIDYQIQTWSIGLYELFKKNAGGINKFWHFQGADAPDIMGNSSTSYAVGVLECKKDQALIIEMDVPNSTYWGLQLGCVWSKPLENTFNQTDINMDRAVIDTDGKFRAVCCHQDPGVPNWMDLVGREELVITLRNYKELGEELIAPPKLTVVKFHELSMHLPKDTPSITTQQRQKNIDHRHDGVTYLFDTVNTGHPNSNR